MASLLLRSFFFFGFVLVNAQRSNLPDAQAMFKPSSGASGESENDVVFLTDSNFDDLVLNSGDIWLIMFYSPSCGLCKSLAPAWVDAATQLKGKVKLGAFKSTKESMKVKEYKVRGYPTIKWFPRGLKSASDANEYEGGRSASDIVNFALDKIEIVIQITTQRNVDKACGENQICIISVLPHILDCPSECRNEYLDLLRSMKIKFENFGWGWLWAEAGAQLALEAALDIRNGYPAMAVVNVRKMQSGLLKGYFSDAGIYEFLRGLIHGRGFRHESIKNGQLPAVVSTERWDGKDGRDWYWDGDEVEAEAETHYYD